MSIENEFFPRLIAKTARDDAALLTRYGPPLLVDDADSRDLLMALAATWPLDRFDEIDIAVSAPFRPQLKRALEPIGPRFGSWAGGRALLPRSHPRVRAWLLRLVGREIGGLRLAKTAIGWFEFDITGPRQ